MVDDIFELELLAVVGDRGRVLLGTLVPTLVCRSAMFEVLLLLPLPLPLPLLPLLLLAACSEAELLFEILILLELVSISRRLVRSCC